MKALNVWLIMFVLLAGVSPVEAQDAPARGIVWIPALGLVAAVYDAPIVEIDGVRIHAVPTDDVGWLAGTVWLDADWGRLVLAGHTPGVFETLDDLQVGDVLWVVDVYRAEQYGVTALWWVDASETGWLAPTATETVLLMTCAGGPTRLLVAARRIH